MEIIVPTACGHPLSPPPQYFAAALFYVQLSFIVAKSILFCCCPSFIFNENPLNIWKVTEALSTSHIQWE